MRGSAVRGAAALAAAALTALAVTASAAQKPLVVTDITGDGNAVNDQFFGVVDNVATPVSRASNDLVKATLANTAKAGKCTGFTLTLEFAGDVDPEAPVIYRLLGATTANDGIFQIYLDNGPVAGGATEVRHGAGDEDRTFPLRNPAKIAGKKITITVTDREIKAFGDKPGHVISEMVFENRVSSGASFFPVVDRVSAGDRTFAMCG